MFAFIPVVLAAVGLVSASPLEMQKRAAFSPAIVTPDAISRWTAGTQATVTWNADTVPADADAIPWLRLYTLADHSRATFKGELASEINPFVGNVTFDVPADLSSGLYYVFLGDWENVSPEFYIDDADHPMHIDA